VPNADLQLTQSKKKSPSPPRNQTRGVPLDIANRQNRLKSTAGAIPENPFSPNSTNHHGNFIRSIGSQPLTAELQSMQDNVEQTLSEIQGKMKGVERKVHHTQQEMDNI
jgi:hypothetical protein